MTIHNLQKIIQKLILYPTEHNQVKVHVLTNPLALPQIRNLLIQIFNFTDAEIEEQLGHLRDNNDRITIDVEKLNLKEHKPEAPYKKVESFICIQADGDKMGENAEGPEPKEYDEVQ